MSTHNDAFSFPFISNLIANGIGVSAAHLQHRTLPMKEKAICLDDDPLSLRLVEHLLKKRYEVISCASVEGAIKMVKKHRAELFLCDYHLGDRITGAEAYEILRREHGFRPLHRILITSYPSQEITEQSRAIGFDCVFAKPLRKEFQAHCLNLHAPPRMTCPVVAG